MIVREYSEADLDAVAQVFTDAVHHLASAQYNAEQCSAWAPQPPDRAEWRNRLQGIQILVAVDDNRVIGFIAYEHDGHIDLLFVSPSNARRGVASALYGCVETALASRGVAELYTEASLVARGFFEQVGFVITEEQEVTRRGATFRRFAMRKRLTAG